MRPIDQIPPSGSLLSFLSKLLASTCMVLFVLFAARQARSQPPPRDSVRTGADIAGRMFYDVANSSPQLWPVLIDSMMRLPEINQYTPRLPIESKAWYICTVLDEYFERKEGPYVTIGFVFHDSLGQTVVAEAPDPRLPILRDNPRIVDELSKVRANLRQAKKENLVGRRSKQRYQLTAMPFVEPSTPRSKKTLILSPILQIYKFGDTPGSYR